MSSPASGSMEALRRYCSNVKTICERGFQAMVGYRPCEVLHAFGAPARLRRLELTLKNLRAQQTLSGSSGRLLRVRAFLDVYRDDPSLPQDFRNRVSSFIRGFDRGTSNLDTAAAKGLFEKEFGPNWMSGEVDFERNVPQLPSDFNESAFAGFLSDRARTNPDLRELATDLFSADSHTAERAKLAAEALQLELELLRIIRGRIQ